MYPGMVALILAAVALVSTPAATAVYGILLVASVDLSFGVNGLLYPRLLDAVPLVASLRAPARFDALVIVSLSILSAMGAARLMTARRAPRLLGAILAALMLVEYWAAPISTRRDATQPPSVYAWLAAQPRSVVVELPLPVPERLWGYETDYQLMSIYHWQQLVNGYSGYAPRGYLEFLNDMRTFPDENSLRGLAAKHVKWIVIHEGLLDPSALASLMEQVVTSKALRSIGTYADPWGQAVVLELQATTS